MIYSFPSESFFCFCFFNQFYVPFKIIDYFSSYETGQSVGWAKTGEPREKPPDTPASRTWLVSHVVRAGLEPTPDTAGKLFLNVLNVLSLSSVLPLTVISPDLAFLKKKLYLSNNLPLTAFISFLFEKVPLFSHTCSIQSNSFFFFFFFFFLLWPPKLDFSLY